MPSPAVPPVLVTGTVAYDTLETPFGRAERALGGSATYFAAAASFFAPVRLVAVVGGDFDDAELDFLRKRGVDLTGLERQEEGKTFHWSGRYHFDLNTRDTLATDLNVLATFDPTIPEGYADSRVVFLANLEPVTQRKVLAQVKAPDYVVMDTMNFWIEGARDELVKTIGHADALIVNDEEARELSGEYNLVKAARVIRDMGPSTLVIKKGEHGALLFTDGGVFSAPAYPLEEVFDPTGAGDSFAGGFVGSLAHALAAGGRDALTEDALRRAVVHGSALASFTVEKFSVERLRDVERAELEERVSAFRDLVRFQA